MAQSDRYKKLHTRYEALTARATAGGSLVLDMVYADFLKWVLKRCTGHWVPGYRASRLYCCAQLSRN